MKNIKILLTISLMIINFGILGVEKIGAEEIKAGLHNFVNQHLNQEAISVGVRNFAQQHSEDIAIKISKGEENEITNYNVRDSVATWHKILESLNNDEISLTSIDLNNAEKQFLVGAVQAQLDSSSNIGFKSGSKMKNEDNSLISSFVAAQELLDPWIKKNHVKITAYLNAKNIEKIDDFEEIRKACIAKKINLPDSLREIDRLYLMNEINVALELLNPSESFEYKEYFTSKDMDYINDYLIPKLIKSGYKSIDSQELEKFLEKLPNKGFTGKSIENKFGKFSSSLKKSFSMMISDHLVTSDISMKSLSKIVEVVKELASMNNEPVEVQFEQYIKNQNIVFGTDIRQLHEVLNEFMLKHKTDINQAAFQAFYDKAHADKDAWMVNFFNRLK